MEQAEWRNNHIIESWQGNWSPQKIDTVSQLGTQFDLPMTIYEGAILGDKYLKHAFAPPLVLDKNYI